MFELMNMEKAGNDINVNWVEMNPEKHSIGEEKKLYPSPIPGHYENLYWELIEKCNPEKYSSQFEYNYEKLKIANELYSDIIKAGSINKEKLLPLRTRAVKELGIRISTEDLYNTLLKQTNPHRFMKPYNKEMVALANEFHQQTMLYADNIEKLEDIESQVNANPAFVIHYGSIDSDDVDNSLTEGQKAFLIIAFGTLIIFLLMAILANLG